MEKSLSIIIPHRDRVENLRLCLASIAEAATHRPDIQVQVVVVDNGSQFYWITPKPQGCWLRIYKDDTPMPIFNKSRLLNLGIEHSTGDILTFLDADAIVAPGFFDSHYVLDDPTVTLLCHRVRYLEQTPSHYSPSLFDDYDRHPLAYEGRQCPRSDLRGLDHVLPVFGNSQCSIRRETIGDLRFNEEFVGAGFEDLWFLREVWRRAGENYKGVMPTDPLQSMYHIRSRTAGDMPGWRTAEILEANRRRYDAT